LTLPFLLRFLDIVSRQVGVLVYSFRLKIETRVIPVLPATLAIEWFIGTLLSSLISELHSLSLKIDVCDMNRKLLLKFKTYFANTA
jgi:hypothetical protein